MDFALPDSVIRWISSFLCHRRQRIKIGDVMFGWWVMNAGMPHGSFFGPLMFITLIVSWWTSWSMHKFTDDSTLSEFVAKSTSSCMKACCDELVHQSEEIWMNVNAARPRRCWSARWRKIHHHSCRSAVQQLNDQHSSCWVSMPPATLSGRNTLMLWFARWRRICTFSSSWGELICQPETCFISTLL